MLGRRFLLSRSHNLVCNMTPVASKTTQSHYEAHDTESYESAFFYSPGEYMDYLTKLTISKLGWSTPPSQTRRLLDIGGGTGNFTRMIVKDMDHVEAIVVDPFLGDEEQEANKTAPQVRFVKADAESFLLPSEEWWRKDYHQVLMKEVIHHLDPSQRLPIFQGIHNEVCPAEPNSPALLIVTRPQFDHDYPLWDEARLVWAANQPSLQDIQVDLQTAGFSRVEHTVEAYPCSTAMEKWLEMVKSRFWSTFSNFTNDELEEACKRIAIDEKARVDKEGLIHFEDRLLFISAHK